MDSHSDPHPSPRPFVLFGATGHFGRVLLSRALAAGHAVTAVTRRPDVLGALGAAHTRLERRAGDVLEPSSWRGALDGSRAVISCLGDAWRGRIRAAGHEPSSAAMRERGATRLISMSTLGAGDSEPNLNFFWRRVMFGLLLRKAFDDHARQEVIVSQSGLDWTLVRPGALAKGEATGTYREGFGPGESVALKIGMEDLADFMLRQLGDTRYLRRAVSVSM